MKALVECYPRGNVQVKKKEFFFTFFISSEKRNLRVNVHKLQRQHDRNFGNSLTSILYTWTNRNTVHGVRTT